MRYIKQYEKKTDIDFDKIYTCKTSKGFVKYAGKFSLPYHISGESGSLLKGVVIECYGTYLSHNNVEGWSGTILTEGGTMNLIIRGNDWRCIKEATQEEIEKYELVTSIKKYNL